MVGRLARATIAAGHRPQIQPPNDLHYEPSQVALRQPLVHRGWQQKAGLAVNRAEVAHASDVRGSQVLRCHLFYRTIPRRVKSDRLLEVAVLPKSPDGLGSGSGFRPRPTPQRRATTNRWRSDRVPSRPCPRSGLSRLRRRGQLGGEGQHRRAQTESRIAERSEHRDPRLVVLPSRAVQRSLRASFRKVYGSASNLRVQNERPAPRPALRHGMQAARHCARE